MSWHSHDLRGLHHPQECSAHHPRSTRTPHLLHEQHESPTFLVIQILAWLAFLLTALVAIHHSPFVDSVFVGLLFDALRGHLQPPSQNRAHGDRYLLP